MDHIGRCKTASGTAQWTPPPARLSHPSHLIEIVVKFVRSDLTESVLTVVLQKSIPPRTRQLILYISNSKGQVDEFVREMTFAKRLYKQFL